MAGGNEFSLVDIYAEGYEYDGGYYYFKADGEYILMIPDEQPKFPYKVQITCDGKAGDYEFADPDGSVEAEGYTFRLMMPNAISTMSMLPLEEISLNKDLLNRTPLDMTFVSVGDIFTAEQLGNGKVMSKYGWGDYDDYYDNNNYNASRDLPIDDYSISNNDGTLNLSRNTSSGYSSGSYDQSNKWEMIVGDKDQLQMANKRYKVTIKTTDSRKWLTPTAYSQDSTGNSADVTVLDDYRYYDNDVDNRNLYFRVPYDAVRNGKKVFVKLAVDNTNFTKKYDSIQVYEGRHQTAESAKSGADITDKIFNTGYDMSGKYGWYENKWITMVALDSSGNALGCLPFKLNMSTASSYLSYSGLFGSNNGSVSSNSSTNNEGKLMKITFKLDQGYPANGQYNLKMYYVKDGTRESDAASVTAAYVGDYASIEAATAAGAENIKSALFGSEGYKTDYSQGVKFSIFVGTTLHKYIVYAEEYKDSGSSGSSAPTISLDSLHSGTAVKFTGLVDENERELTSSEFYIVDRKEDSYAEFNFKTIFVSSSVNLAKLAPVFTTDMGVKLYAPGKSEPEVSGKSYQDFSKGPIQYTAGSEDRTVQQNYWLEVVKVSSDTSKMKLSVNSLGDLEDAKTEEKDGVTYSTRQVMLDGLHDNVHDILFTNMGSIDIPKLSAVLVSDMVVVDPYWTLDGTTELKAFAGTTQEKPLGELKNMAKVRLRAKDGVTSGDVTGTLTVKSGETTLMVLTLTGTIGNPHITTESVPGAVKYVPYGTMIQNNNKYSWNHVTYSLEYGELPDGMQVYPNGELYGVPKSAGTFTFTVLMKNSSSFFKDDSKTFTLTIAENTDDNVKNATDAGYTVLNFIPDVPAGLAQDQVFRSEGQFGEFKKVFLDGNELVKDTDYVANEGSTRITIKAETMKKQSKGKHTLGVEFRQGDNTLKRAAQNFNVGEGIRPSASGGGGGSSNDGGSSDDGGSSGGSASAAPSKPKTPSVTAADVVEQKLEDATYQSIVLPVGGEMLKLSFFNKAYGANEKIIAYLKNGMAFVMDINAFIAAGKDINLACNMKKLENFAPGFQAISLSAAQKTLLGHEISYNMVAGAEYANRPVYVFMFDVAQQAYIPYAQTLVSPIGTIGFMTNQMTDYIIMIAE